MKYLLIVCIILAVPYYSIAQQLQGIVTDDQYKPLHGATVTWLQTKQGTATNINGEFSIPLPKKGAPILIISHTGFKADTIKADGSYLTVSLARTSALNDVTVFSAPDASYIAASPIKMEVITSLELKKAACCDLAGCFETQATVQPHTTNIITNSKELRILGLSGIYNQVLIDGFPQVQGLTYTYGISSIPGILVDNIWVAKGANSVLQGYESISGQINVITSDPEKADKLLLNAYMNSFGEKHMNAVYSIKNKKWSNLTALHVVTPAGKTDKDGDTFLDLPLLSRIMIANRWKKGDENKWGWSTQLGIKALSERRIGGQTHFTYKNKGTAAAYGQTVDIQQPEAWFKTAYRMNDVHRFAIYLSGFHQDQESYFGITSYKANQTNGYANLQYENSYKAGSVLKTGFSYRYMNLEENIRFSDNILGRTYAGLYRKKENIPGVFAENTLNLADNKLTWILGVRADHHNTYGWNVTPRTLLKYQPTVNLTIRGSIGTGWRTANIFSENPGLLVSSRDIVFEGTLRPEKAMNTGFNVTQKFKGNKLDGTISFDFYNTSFTNQVFPEYDEDPSKAIIRKFTGKSVSNGFQAEASVILHNRFSAKLAYVYLDVYQYQGSIKKVLPFNSRHRVNGSLSYMPLSKKWHIDANVHWYGKQGLPVTSSNPPQYRMPSQSKAYSIVNSQFTYAIKKFELYTGIENIFNLRQDKPIISWQDPFGRYFDTQFAWGPTRGREMYVGLRFRLKD